MIITIHPSSDGNAFYCLAVVRSISRKSGITIPWLLISDAARRTVSYLRSRETKFPFAPFCETLSLLGRFLSGTPLPAGWHPDPCYRIPLTPISRFSKWRSELDSRVVSDRCHELGTGYILREKIVGCRWVFSLPCKYCIIVLLHC